MLAFEGFVVGCFPGVMGPYWGCGGDCTIGV